MQVYATIFNESQRRDYFNKIPADLVDLYIYINRNIAYKALNKPSGYGFEVI